ncbi:TIM barrel protein [candidate division KSB1 bacterium]|nr:TIM barrel protein [candidate division KSB1 bacterium]
MKPEQIELAFCLETLFSEKPFVERFSAARTQGIRCIEFWDHRSKNLNAVGRALSANGLKVTNFSGNRKYGMLLAGVRDAFVREVSEAMGVAKALGCPRLMLLVQPLCEDGSAEPLPSDTTRKQKIDALIACGHQLASLADDAKIDFVIEPLNTEIDHPNYFLSRSKLAFDCIREINHPRVKILYDIYHMATMGEDVIGDLSKNIDVIGYIHIADVPGRHEPGSGSLDFRGIYRLLKSLAYDRPIGFEFFPSNADSGAAVEKTLQLFA